MPQPAFGNGDPDAVNLGDVGGDARRWLAGLSCHRYRLPPVRILCMFRMNSLPAPPSASLIVVPV